MSQPTQSREEIKRLRLETVELAGANETILRENVKLLKEVAEFTAQREELDALRKKVADLKAISHEERRENTRLSTELHEANEARNNWKKLSLGGVWTLLNGYDDVCKAIGDQEDTSPAGLKLRAGLNRLYGRISKHLKEITDNS